MKKRIGIDARLLKQTGVGIYTENLLINLEEIAPESIEFYIYLRSKDIREINFKKKQFIKQVADYQWHSFNEQFGFAKKLYADNLDLMHFTYFSYPFLYKKPFIITTHDLIPFTHATGRASTKNHIVYLFKKYMYEFLIRSAVKNAQQIITPTNTIKNQITTIFGEIYKQKITVTYEGVHEKLITAKANQDLKKQYKQPFFIYIGNFYPHKNVENLIRAFSHTHIPAKLVLIGPEDFFAQKMQAVIHEENQQDRIHMYQNPTIDDFVFFYQNAQALIHPSLSEGFGLPLIEAAYFNCPVIASNIPVFQEILGDNYTTFDPEDIYEMARVIDDFSPSKKYILDKKFSFEKLAKSTHHVYENSIDL